MKAIMAATFMVLSATATAGAAEPNQYLCLVEASAGLHYDPQSQSWRPQAFTATEKYILRRINDSDRKGKWSQVFKQRPEANWAFFEFGDPSRPAATCSDQASEFSASRFACEQFSFDAAFDKDTLRFETTRRGAYMNQGDYEHMRQKEPDRFKQLLSQFPVLDPSHPDDLSFEVGRCSPF
jgi:hypothetical protein